MQLTPTIIHVDTDIIVIEKPTMLLSVPGRGEDKQDCVVSRLAIDYPEALIVHRLDWETSGLMVLARNREAHRELSRQFQDREVEKQYISIVYGSPPEDHGSIDLPLRCDWPNRPRQMVDHKQGKAALTHWRVLSRDNDRSRIELTPVTGRSHQLRVHLLSIDNPILGDQLYAHEEALQMANRLMLHATSLSFRHPCNRSLLSFDSPPF
ncbi:RNA pseudouridine synthase [Solemya pervernicosa gill symbiont]|uniref:Pseudouridine synthase n=2 Tax=Gammaproteobacteria incertae sedis TaxID=118884 RepID=A0A1T2L3T1_9GAMM|nr:RluA family pseudouridine synthase [Candidatus Reidiella endopervernicosa]OOZ39757.1 RNA pseudouridine synthase [Solemya pervernicosa gill symbiont]QKQ27912.1 RluA family pseudouridine synthase [Candidatus Reidiella endopervernicosa]